MKQIQLDNVFPKNSVLPVYFFACTMTLVVFDISLLALIGILALDFLVLAIIRPFELALFYKIFPEYIPLKKLEAYAENSADSFENQKKFFNNLSSFPEKRSLYAVLTSCIKVLPVGVCISLLTKVTDSFFMNLLYFYIMDSFILVLFHGVQFISLHEIGSQFFATLRNKEGWKEHYWELRPYSNQDRFALVQNITLMLLLINLLLICFIVATVETIRSQNYIFVLFAAVFFGIATVQYHFQKFIRDSLKSMFTYLNQDFSKKNIEVLPLHTSPLLAGFESTVNQLGHNLQMREQEIQEWLKYESEQFHLRSLGEITALVAHDIKTPLHVMQMSLEMINDPKSSPETVARYKYILERNLTQTISFTATLMSYLRGEGDDSGCSFTEIHLHLIDLFKTQYPEDIFNRIDFQLAAGVTDLELKSSRMDTMHIFYNLYQNAIRSVLQDDKERPAISIWVEKSHDVAQIYIRDNGQGLSLEKFNLLTAFEQTTKNGNFKKGLGLRITKTILSYHKGELELIPTESGACFKVSIPMKEYPKNVVAPEDSSSASFQ